MVSRETQGTPLEESPDRIVIRLDPGGPIELDGLGESFTAIARFYRRHFRPHPELDQAPKLYIARLENGSVVAEIVPYVMLLGGVVPYMDAAMIVSDFTTRLYRAVQAFSDTSVAPPLVPSIDEAGDIREFIKPLVGRRGARLGIAHARFHSRTGEKEVVVEYSFDEAQINQAALTIDRDAPLLHELETEALPAEGTRLLREVMLVFQQASRGRGKEEGRTSDKAVVPAVTDKPLPVYFREGIQDLKDRMIRGLENPLQSVYFVDVIVQFVENKPKGYIVTDVHRVIPED